MLTFGQQQLAQPALGVTVSEPMQPRPAAAVTEGHPVRVARAPALALGLAWLLSACTAASTGSPSSAASTPSPTQSPTATPAPTGSPTAEATPTSSELAFPSPVAGQAVYDQADVIGATTESALEQQIGDIEARSGAEIVVLVRLDPAATSEGNLAAARQLLEQWGVGGAAGANDGLVILVSVDESLEHGMLSTYADSGLLTYLPLEAQATLRDEVMIPAFRSDSIEAGIVAGIQYVDEAIP